MKKRDLALRLSVHFPDLRRKDLEALVEAAFEEMTQALLEDRPLEFRGFGRLEVHHGRERLFVNPKNQKTYHVRGNRRVVFKVGKDLQERLNRPPRAVLDLGTQTFRLALGKGEGRGLRVIFRHRVNVRLGEGFREGKLSPQAIQRGLATLAEFRKILDHLGVEQVQAVGTAILREAQNAEDFHREARRLGFAIRPIPGEEEAELVLKGVLHGLKLADPFFLVDAGGGSTEVSLVREGRRIWGVSLPFGAVKLRERFVRDYPLTREEFQGLRNYLVREFQNLRPPEIPSRFVACGGTASLLAALDLRLAYYLPEKLHGHRLPLERVQALVDHLRGLSLSKIARLRGMERGREDIALPGILIYEQLMRHFGLKELLVSEWGLLEGLLLSF
ncbi:hypothetical protein FVE67_08860 [Thermosulfurimonas marina]|uniref:Ppx/GppA phosphatase N-terminal domain-containing protein n=1 Tax=Thermosulfurimonas marina TaxID=2047767 RepID=A0A6H1WUL6_9BACT|nr:HU family DNA-binding protein [Thermosulfurimonas marina]QJA06892.1 hypothetical protein FVE67_08860 [Thermosulfurimonas marina]